MGAPHVKVTDAPAKYSFGHVVGLAAFDMVQPWAELDVAGVGLSFANWMGCHFPIAFVLMLDLLYSGPGLLASESALD